MQYSVVQYSIFQYSVVQYSRLQYSVVQYSILQFSLVHYSRLQYSVVQYSRLQYSVVQYKRLQYGEVQYSRLYSVVNGIEGSLNSRTEKEKALTQMYKFDNIIRRENKVRLRVPSSRASKKK